MYKDLFEPLLSILLGDQPRSGGAESKGNSVLNFLSDLEPVSDNLKSRIASIEDIDTLTMLNKKAARAKSIEEFERELTAQNY